MRSIFFFKMIIFTFFLQNIKRTCIKVLPMFRFAEAARGGGGEGEKLGEIMRGKIRKAK